MSATQGIYVPIESGDVAMVRQLLDVDPGLVHVRRIGAHDNPGGTGTTPLQLAAMRGNLDIVKLLLERGAQAYATAQWGYPAIEHAHWEKQQHIVDFLFAEGAKATGAPTYGLGIDVNLAARNGWTDIVKKHIGLDPLAVHRRGVIGETPLHWSAHNGFVEIVLALLDAGADVDADEIGCYGGKPLHWAAEHSPEIVKLLLERGAKVDSRNVTRTTIDLLGVTPLIMCARQRNDCAECAELLITAGADIRAVDGKGRSALDSALKSGCKRIEALLRKQGAV